MSRLHFSDEISAFSGIKKARFKDKGKYACAVARRVFEALKEAGIDSWYVSAEDERDLQCLEVQKFPLRFIIRNRLVGTVAQQVCDETGAKIPNVIHELRLLREDICNPMINTDYAVAFGIADSGEMETMNGICDRANEVLKALFHKAGIELVDFKLEFGRTEDGRIVIACAVTPDNARLWDEESGKVLDKDRFRQDMSDVCASYKEIMERL